MSAIQMSLAYEYPTVELSRTFIDHYMPCCTPTYALIYIYSLRQCIGGAAAVSSQEIARTFHILETDVHNAWRHWESAGLIQLENKGDGLTITFLPVREPAPAAEEIIQPALSVVAEKINPALAAGEVRPFVLAGRPQYTVEELIIYRQQSQDIERLFTHAEQALGKLLTYHDLNVLFGFYDWLRLPVDVILYMLNYCAEHDHRDLRYIEKCALDWAEHQIDDLEKALEYIQVFDRDYRDILYAMGAGVGFPTQSQRKYIKKWLNEYNMAPGTILLAISRAAAQIDRPKFAYVDKILEDWNKQGIHTETDAKANDEARTRRKAEAIKAEAVKAEPKQKSNRFVNFKQRERDYAQLEKMEREYLVASLER